MKYILSLSFIFLSVLVVGVKFGATEVVNPSDHNSRTTYVTYYPNGASVGISNYCDSTGYTPLWGKNTGSGYEYVKVDPDVYGPRSDSGNNGYAYVSHHHKNRSSVTFSG